MAKRQNRRLFWQTLKITRVYRVFYTYLIYFFIAAVLIWLIEPSIPRLSDSLWYCFASATTVGYGNFTAVTLAGRIITVILAVYSIVLFSVLTAVVAEFFIDVVKRHGDGSVIAFMDELERLPELSREELEDLSRRVRKFRADRGIVDRGTADRGVTDRGVEQPEDKAEVSGGR